MNHEQLAKVLQKIRPGCQFNLRGLDIEWLTKNVKAPTKKELEEGLTLLKDEAYRDQRALEYPPIGDQLDAVWKGGEAAEAMRKQIRAIKKKYPKS